MASVIVVFEESQKIDVRSKLLVGVSLDSDARLLLWYSRCTPQRLAPERPGFQMRQIALRRRFYRIGLLYRMPV